MQVVPSRSSVLLLGIALSCAACGSDDSGDGASNGQVAEAALYGVQSLIFNDTGSTSYVSLLPSLDGQQSIMLASAREFAGYAPMDPFQGALFVASGERPAITRYDVSDRGEWTAGQTIDFSAYTSMALEASIYVAPDTAYVPYDGTNHLRWNPQTFSVTREVGAPPQIPLVREGLNVRRGNGHVLRGRTLFQPYYFSNDAYQKYTQISQISVIDTQTDTVKPPIDVPCPHLHITSQDDEGNIYMSNGQGSIAAAVLDPTHPRNCFVRIPKDAESADPASVVEFRSLTDGREGSNLFYIGGGRALFNVYHAERDNFPANVEYQKIDYSSNFHLWTVDLNTRQARMMEGVDYAGGQFIAFRIDGRTLVAIPAADYSTTAVYEVSPEGRAEKRFDVQGWAMKIFRVR